MVLEGGCAVAPESAFIPSGCFFAFDFGVSGQGKVEDWLIAPLCEADFPDVSDSVDTLHVCCFFLGFSRSNKANVASFLWEVIVLLSLQKGSVRASWGRGK
jgi:hypothetical protein